MNSTNVADVIVPAGFAQYKQQRTAEKTNITDYAVADALAQGHPKSASVPVHPQFKGK